MKRKIPLKHYRKYPPELKLALCKDREKGLSLRECAKKYKLFRPGCKKPPDSLILGWEKLYKELGPKCFFVNRQGNHSQYGSDGEPTSTTLRRWPLLYYGMFINAIKSIDFSYFWPLKDNAQIVSTCEVLGNISKGIVSLTS